MSEMMFGGLVGGWMDVIEVGMSSERGNQGSESEVYLGYLRSK